MGNLEQLKGLFVVQMMQDSEGEDSIKVVSLRQRELTHALANESGCWKTTAGLLYVFRAGVKSYILRDWQVRNNSPGPTSNF